VPVYIPSLGEQVGAVVSVPADRRSCVGVVLLAGRARSRAHRNGLLAKTAGTLAGQGMYALRLDYPGVGNSTGLPTLPGLDDMPSRTVEHACRFLLEHTPVRRILLAGTCYGGRVVLDAAPRIPEVDGVVLVAAPVLRPASSGTRLRLRSARARGRGRVDPGFVDALERFLPRGRVCFLYGDREDLLADLRVALDQLELPADRYELDLVPGEIHSFRSLAMQALTHERLSAWCRRSAEAMRERA
jgi:pimeloyl-ACP methyl ester carboxylesterase